MNMFGNKRPILYVSRETIVPAVAVGSGASLTVKREKELSWTKETLAQTFLDLKKDLVGPFSVILDEGISFTIAVSIPADVKEERSFVRIKAIEMIPEDISEFGWDFKEALASIDKKDKMVQVVAADASCYALLARAAKDAGVKVTAMEPMVCSLARIIALRKESIMVFYKLPDTERTIAFLSYHGVVFFTESFSVQPVGKDLVKLFQFARERTDFVPSVVLLAGDLTALDEKTPEFGEYTVERADLDPFVGMAMKTDAEGDDAASLNIPLVAQSSSQEKDLEGKIVGISEIGNEGGVGRYEPIGLADASVERYPQGKRFTYAILTIAAIVAVANGVIWYERNQTEQQIELLIGTPSLIVATSSAGISASSFPGRADYPIEVLNGGGKSGAAAAAGKFLTSGGYTVADTGNADNDSYQGITVSYQSNVPSAYRTGLENDLAAQYDTIPSMGSVLGPQEKVEVVIIIGK